MQSHNGDGIMSEFGNATARPWTICRRKGFPAELVSIATDDVIAEIKDDDESEGYTPDQSLIVHAVNAWSPENEAKLALWDEMVGALDDIIRLLMDGEGVSFILTDCAQSLITKARAIGGAGEKK
jgi:hypothetical protein